MWGKRVWSADDLILMMILVAEKMNQYQIFHFHNIAVSLVVDVTEGLMTW